MQLFTNCRLGVARANRLVRPALFRVPPIGSRVAGTYAHEDQASHL